MKNWLKRINFGLLCILGLFYLTSMQVLAEVQDERPRSKDGEMRFKIERIGEKDDSNEEGHKNIETELEKKFPELFQDETRATIRSKQEADEKSKKELEQLLFKMPSSPDTALNDMKESLFSPDYVAPAMVTSSNENIEDNNAGPMNNKTFAGLTGLIGLLSVGAYVMLQSLSE